MFENADVRVSLCFVRTDVNSVLSFHKYEYEATLGKHMVFWYLSHTRKSLQKSHASVSSRATFWSRSYIHTLCRRASSTRHVANYFGE